MSSPVSMTQMSERPDLKYCRVCGGYWPARGWIEFHKAGCPCLRSGTRVLPFPERPRKVSQ